MVLQFDCLLLQIIRLARLSVGTGIYPDLDLTLWHGNDSSYPL